MDLATELAQIQANARRESAAVHAQLDDALRAVPAEFRAHSRDGRVVAVCDARGRVVDIAMPHGMTGDGVAPWEVQEKLNAIGHAIVSTVNEARQNAANAGYQQCRQAFPGWFDLLTDLEPKRATPPGQLAPQPPPPVTYTRPVRPVQPTRYLDDEDEDGPPASWLE